MCFECNDCIVTGGNPKGLNPEAAILDQETKSTNWPCSLGGRTVFASSQSEQHVCSCLWKSIDSAFL